MRFTSLAVVWSMLLVATGCAEQAEQRSELDLFLDPSNRQGLAEYLASVESSFQEVLEECLRGEGFEYFADDSDQAEAQEFAQSDPVASLFRFTPSETGSFGIADELLGRDEFELVEGTNAPVDANLDYLDSLSGSDRAVYDRTRFGPGGCEERASAESGEERVLQVSDEAAEIQSVVGSRVDADAEFRVYVSDWSRCMIEREGRESGAFGSPFEMVFRLEQEGHALASAGGDLVEFEQLERRLGVSSLACGGGTELQELVDHLWGFYLEDELERR